ncbi:hypothetical protein EGW08_012520 [Elysia chlorotica]|uniref:NADPH-dependent FMN reductase-like domain-containing protein n=1 Tax=Elysia chlorotica TaxID=188477 RepID=A0A433TDP5_ELYCH|nr:hypothetical protein EGW08_012520 [Elysia chlorotica]
MYQRYRQDQEKMAAPKLRCVLFLGSTREGRLGLRVAKFMASQLEKRNYQVDIFGIYGGMRAAMQLRAFLSELGTLSVSNIFGIPEVHKALSEDGSPLSDHMEKGADKLLAQLDWMAWAMKNHRDTQGLPK